MATAVVANPTNTLEFPEWAQVLFRPKRYKVIRGGRGSTKSWSIARALIILSCAGPERILCTRELQTSISESVHHLLEHQINAMGLAPYFEIQQQAIYRKPYNAKDAGSSFIFYGIKSNPTKIKSTEGITRCWVEEAEKISSRSWEILIPTIRVPGSEIWISFNPDEENDPTYQRFVTNAPSPEECDSIEVNWQDNPWFDQTELVKEKDYLYRVDPEAADHVWGGQCRRNASAQIFRGKYIVQSFTPPDPALCDKEHPMWDGPYFGADWGFSQDPVVLTKVWVDSYHKDAEGKKRPRLYVEYAVGGVGIELDAIATLFKRVPGVEGKVIRADNARPETISHVKGKGYCESMTCDFVFNRERPEPKCPKCGGKAKYLRVEGAEKWKGSVEDGIAWLKQFEIVFHPRCELHIQEARLYSYKVDRLTRDVLTDIEDRHNHCWDADRYACQPMIYQGTRIGLWSRL